MVCVCVERPAEPLQGASVMAAGGRASQLPSLPGEDACNSDRRRQGTPQVRVEPAGRTQGQEKEARRSLGVVLCFHSEAPKASKFTFLVTLYNLAAPNKMF